MGKDRARAPYWRQPQISLLTPHIHTHVPHTHIYQSHIPLTMYSKLPRKTFPTASKLALENASPSPSLSPSPASRLPTFTSRIPSSKKSANASSQGKENIPPFSKKQGSTRSAPAKIMVADEHKIKKGADLGDVKRVRSIAKDEKKESFVRPVLACLSEALDSVQMDFDDEDWETGLAAAKISTPKKRRITHLDGITLSCTESLFDVSSPLAKRHNDSIEVTRKRSLARLSRGNMNEADITLDAVPDSLTERIEYIDPVEYFDDAEVADDTFDLSEMLNKLDAPEERLMDTSLSELMNVEINYSLEFPNTAVGRPPHIFVAKYKRDKKRAAQRALENSVQNNRCVLQDECIIDIPLQDWAPLLKWKVLMPENYNAPIPKIPSLIVTSPSDGDLASAMYANNATAVDYDQEAIASGSYKDLQLDASWYNWTIRFGEVLPADEAVAEEEEMMPAIPEIIVTSPNGDLHFEVNAEEDLNEIW
ncbi:hypothetical protein F5887DRAFT_612761 [Amanita rubescens]|nr:hypothetical protein F5887DRAFT_612761 [Amanita rubescens]